jgi:hypothetical protein
MKETLVRPKPEKDLLLLLFDEPVEEVKENLRS